MKIRFIKYDNLIKFYPKNIADLKYAYNNNQASFSNWCYTLELSKSL